MINVLAVTHHARENINPIRPEASQIIGLHKTGKVRVTALCNPNSPLIALFESHGIEVFTDKLDKKFSLSTIKKIKLLVKQRDIKFFIYLIISLVVMEQWPLLVLM